MPTKEFQDTVQHFSFFLLDKGRKPSTIKRYAYDIEDFGQWLQKSKKLPLRNIWTTLSKEDYEEYFNDWGSIRKMRIYNAKHIFLTMHPFFTTLRKF
ncbi:hypothetical protein ABVF88_13125 [Bacillus mycoides]|uniref:hypothetical protein n=1 Tax=unclassified Bacillus (in: firmicutes) TaxID=185979 RepID=UPI0027DD780A|nr:MULTISPECIES: hypothetical protein [unclassified Bacillus (in: firmicutes)]